MLRPVTCTSAVLVALALAFPAAGLAQGAGDQQYSDPFTESDGGGNSGSGNSGSGNSGSGGGNSGSGNSGSGSSAPSQAPSTAGNSTTQTPQAAAPQAAQGAAELPRTGYPVWLAVLAGGVLLASGAMLRVSLGLRR